MAKILLRMFSTRMFCSLSVRERGAVTEAIRIALIARGPTSDAERLELRRRLLSLPWAWEQSPTSDRPSGLACDLLAHVEDPAILAPIAMSIASALHHVELRENLLRAMLALALADGSTERDLAMLEPFRTALSISRARAEELLDDLKNELVSLVQ